MSSQEDVGRKETRVRASERWIDKLTGKPVTSFDKRKHFPASSMSQHLHSMNTHFALAHVFNALCVEKCNSFARNFIKPTFARTYAPFFPSNVSDALYRHRRFFLARFRTRSRKKHFAFDRFLTSNKRDDGNLARVRFK